jgi:hypothetical protein
MFVVLAISLCISIYIYNCYNYLIKHFLIVGQALVIKNVDDTETIFTLVKFIWVRSYTS